MSHFYAMIPTSARRTVPTARAHKTTGVETIAAGWKGSIRTYCYEQDGEDHYRVTLEPWQGSGGSSQVIATGILDANLDHDQTAIPNVTHADSKGWLRTIWAALDEVCPQADGTREQGDIISHDGWDEICTAMAWLAEALGHDSSDPDIHG